MATLTLEITIADEDEARVFAAIKSVIATEANPTPSDADAVEWLRQGVLTRIKTTVVDAETRAAINAISEVDAA